MKRLSYFLKHGQRNTVIIPLKSKYSNPELLFNVSFRYTVKALSTSPRRIIPLCYKNVTLKNVDYNNDHYKIQKRGDILTYRKDTYKILAIY